MSSINLILKGLAKIVNQLRKLQSTLNDLKEITESNADAIDILIQIESRRQENKDGRR